MNALLLLVTVLSLATAVVASVVAWRVVTEDRRRSEARVALLAEAIRADEPPDSQPVALSHLLDGPEPARNRQRLLVPAIAGAALVLVLVVGRVAGNGTAPDVSGQGASAAGTASPADAGVPASVDLTALTHELGPDGELRLQGEVRNGPGSANMGAVNVVALLFDRQGAYLSSARAPLQASAAEGGAATFLVRIPDGDRVSRYRVSFRAGDRIVPHVDRRQVP